MIKKLLGFLVGVLLALWRWRRRAGDARRHALAPQPGEWATALHIGPFERQASVPALLRWATHSARAAGTRRSPHRRLAAEAEGAYRLRRALRTLPRAAGRAGPAALLIDEARLSVEVRGADRYDGTLRLGRRAPGQHRLARRASSAKAWPCRPSCHPRRWRACCRPSRPLPGAARADRGSVAFQLDDAGAGGWRVAAEADAGGRERRRPWAPRRCAMSTWRSAAARSPRAGASRLDPERGDRRRRPALLRAPATSSRPGSRCSRPTSARASRCRAPAPSPSSSPSCSTPATSATPRASCASGCMRRRWSASLGKGRIPQLYLALLPWGDGICGAEAAARHHLGRAPASSSRAKPPGWPAC